LYDQRNALLLSGVHRLHFLHWVYCWMAGKGGDVTPADLYAMAMESNTAGDLMHEICAALGTPYPPQADDHTEIQPVFNFPMGSQPPVSAAFN
jgi:hypothetical protein